MRQFLSLVFALTLSLSLQADELSLPLAKLMRSPGPIKLRDLADEYALSLPVPERWQVKSAVLVLDFTYSNALVAKRSQLRVQVNGLTIAQWRLDPKTGRRIETVPLPPELLLSGYNELRFLAAQHYTEDQCEANTAPELWTELDPVKSHLVLNYELAPLPLSLAHLAEIFDKKQPEAKIVFLFPDLALGESELAVGSLIAQGIGLRLEYAPFSFTLAQAEPKAGTGPVRFVLPKDQDGVLIGTRERLAPLLDPQLAARIGGPYLGLFSDPQAPGRALLIVSVRNEGEVRQAALAFALMEFPLPDTQDTVIAGLDFEPFLPYQAQAALLPHRTYTFGAAWLCHCHLPRRCPFAV
ncbi:MAG: cellulose biosynthesis cyclic di-GMP-binding regulatory protein BcsB [Methylohalobius sp.]